MVKTKSKVLIVVQVLNSQDVLFYYFNCLIAIYIHLVYKFRTKNKRIVTRHRNISTSKSISGSFIILVLTFKISF